MVKLNFKDSRHFQTFLGRVFENFRRFVPENFQTQAFTPAYPEVLRGRRGFLS